MKSTYFQRVPPHAARCGSAARSGGGPGLRELASLLAGAALVAACALPPAADESVRVATQPQPRTSSERLCAWYGDARDGVLYFGESSFWAALRAQGDPLADARAPGPRRIGRFDLATRRLLPPLEAGPADSPTGVWDVLVHPSGRVYFTTWFDAMGWVDLRSGQVVRLPDLGVGLNELAPGPGGSILVSRYGGEGGERPGSVLAIEPDGRLRFERALAAPAGLRVAPKTVGFDEARGEIWVTTDLVGAPGAGVSHDARVLDAAGRELRRIERPEIQFVAFRPGGGGVLAEVEGARLWLRLRPASGEDRLVLADERFANGLDFVQDVHFAADGTAVVTRWSGVVHRVAGDGSLRTLELPRLEAGGLYYSGVIADGDVCATYCAGITVVCARAGAAPR